MRKARRAALAALLLARISACAQTGIQFDDFADAQSLMLLGTAKVSGQVLRLTPARRNQTGAGWFRDKQPVRSGFETKFQFRLTKQDWLPGFHGTDGFAFVIQNAGLDAIGGRGSAAGFGMPDPTNPRHPGIPWMIAIFFDTCRNPEEGDPSSNYIAIRANGGSARMRWPAARLAFTPALRVRLKDGRAHAARIAFDPPVLSVFLDDSVSPVLKAIVDLSVATDHQGSAWVGFTAATGWGYQNHDILNWSFAPASVSSTASVVSSDISFPMSACLPNHNLCTPERPFAQQKGDVYHVVLPANLEWGVSIPNPSRRAIVITNAHGVVCWDSRVAQSQDCSGASGKGTRAGSGFVREDAPAGALIIKSANGRTWFSVNGPTADVGENEGFYEFDLRME